MNNPLFNKNMAPPFGKSDISNQLIRDSYQYVLQASDEGVMYRINGDFLVNPIFTSGITIYTGFTFVDGNQQSGYVLTSDGSGNATWQPASAATPSSGVTSITVGEGLSANSSTGAVTIVFTGSTGINGEYLPLSGGTVTGDTVFQSGLTANTISATIYKNFPGSSSDNCITTLYVSNLSGCSPVTILTPINITDGANITGATHFYNRASFTGGITVTGDVTSDSVVTGNLSADTISATTLTIVNSSNITSGSITADTYSGNTIIVNNFTAVTVSATTYLNLPESADTKVTGFSLTDNVITLSQNRTDEYSAFTISLSAYTGSSSTSGAYLPLSGGTVTGNTIFQSGLTTNTLTITGLTSSTDSNVVTIDNSGILHTYPISGLTGNTTSGNDGANSGRWILDNITSPPNPNYFYTTSTDFSALTSVDISITASTNADYYYWFALMQNYRINFQDGFLQIQEVGNTNNTGNYFIQTVTNNTTYFTITFIYASSNGTFTNGKEFTISYVFNGPAGPPGPTGVNSVTASLGLSGDTTTGDITIINTAPDKDVVITGGTNIQIVSDYPNFGINFTGTTSSAFTGGTVSGATNFTNGLTANTISATTYYNYPDTFVTGFTLSSNTITLTQNRTDGYSSFTISLSAYTGNTSTSGAFLPLSGGTVTGGTIFQSGVTANTISQTQYIDFTTGSTNPSSVAGRVFFDTTQKALSYFDISNNQVPIAMGQSLYTRVWNATGVQIDKGKVIAITGTSNNLPSAILAVNTHSITSARPIGLAAENIPNGTEGLVLNNGILSGITINGFANGDTLYLSDITPGGYVASTASLAFTARTNEIGYVLQTGSSVGRIYVNINNEDSNLSLTDKERNILEGNVISGGVYEYTGMTQGTGQTINVAYARGWIVKNTYTYATQPDVTNIYYTGGTNIPLTYLTSADATYILINSGATLVQQTTFPTPQQRRENIFLCKVVHPNRSTITSINNTVDFDVSPMAALRDLWTPIKLINQGVVVSYYSANTMNIQTSAGYLWGNGIGWTTNQLNPDSVSISGTSPTTFQYRSRNGSITGSTSNPGDPAAPTGNTTTIDSHHYDDNGSIVPVGANNRATNQRVYLFPTGLIRIQYGQYSYSTMANAIAGIDTEVFVEFSNNRDNGILIGILTVREDASDLSLTTDAQFRFVSKFGELLGGTGGISTTTLQQAYENSTNPEIVINSTLDGLSIKNGTGNADNITNLLEGIPSATTGATSFIRADGLISGSSVSAPTISATTYYGLPKYISATTQSSNVLTSYYSTGGTTTYTPNAATGGTYSNGVITLAGSGTLSTITGLGGSGGGGQVYFLNLSNTQTPYKEFSPVATTATQQTTGTSISSGVTSTLASFLSPVGYPSVNLLPAGIWSFYLHTYKTNVGDSFTAYAQVYKKTSGGTETLLFTTDPGTVDGVSPTPRMVLTDVYYSGTSLDLTDRILVVIKGTNGGTSTSTLTLVTEGSLYYSYATTTFGGGTPIYTTGGTYNNSTGILTFTRTDGNTYTAGTFTYLTGVTSDIQTQLNGKVGTTGNETISGQKTFTSGLTANTVFAGSGSISSSAVMESSSTTKGFLPPRMTEAQRIAITSPATGLMVYQTDGDEGLYINKSFGWIQII